ncbi:hypothetical protein [Bacillus mycoides]|nr:hypothetical protein [Bacillus mycoides]
MKIRVYQLKIRFGTFSDGIEDPAVDRSGQTPFLALYGVKEKGENE